MNLAQQLRDKAASMDLRVAKSETVVRIGQQLAKDFGVEEAVGFLRRAQWAHPSDLAINRELARYLLSPVLAQVQEALRYLTASVALCRSYEAASLPAESKAEVYLDLGHALLEHADLNGACLAYEEAIGLHKGDGTSQAALGLALMEAGKIEAALKSFASLLIDGVVRPAPLPAEAGPIQVGQSLAQIDHRPFHEGKESLLAVARTYATRELFAAAAWCYKSALNGAGAASECLEQAAQSAARGGSGWGKDRLITSPGRRARLRSQALEWLKQLKRQKVQTRLTWDVYEKSSFDHLGGREKGECTEFWTEVRNVLKGG